MTTAIDLDAIVDRLGPQFAARAGELDQTDGFAQDNYDALREEKVFSALVPQNMGGGGANHTQTCGFIRKLAQHCGSTALAVSMHQHLVGTAAANDRAGRPGRKLLERVADGRTVLVSTGANDWLESNGTATRVDGGYLVTATKPFASGSPAGDILVTSAACDSATEGPQVIHFPVPLQSAGIRLLGDWQTLGMRATGSQTVKLEDVFVPDAAIVLRRPRGGYHPAYSVILTVAMPLIMSAYVGIAEGAAEIARKRAARRVDDPVVPYLVGEMENLLATAQIAREDMVRLCNNLDFEPTTELASKILVRKTVCANHVIATAEKALELSGGAGFFRKTGLERLLRDAHAGQFHPLPEKRQQLFTGRLAMGLDPIEPAVRSQASIATAA